MRKTNNKKSIEELQKYYIETLNNESDDNITTLEEANKYLMINFKNAFNLNDLRFYKSYQNYFIYWSKGLPYSLFEYYLRTGESKRVLMKVLDETQEEADKFTEEQSDNLLTTLIFMYCFSSYVYKHLNY